MLDWCHGCQNQEIEGYINSTCLACKWSYPGQEAFCKKKSFFKQKDNDSVRPENCIGQDNPYWIGVEII